MDQIIKAELNKTAFFHDAYTWAALILSHPQDDFSVDEALKYLEELGSNPAIKIDFSEEIEPIRSFYTTNRFDLLELKKEHSYLFIGPFSLPSPPYESYYRNGGVVQGESSIRVERFYQKMGMEIASDFNDTPDHIILEAEFMAALCELEISALRSGHFEQARYLRCAQKELLNSHLLQWIKTFRVAVEKSAGEALYPAAVKFLEKVAREHQKYWPPMRRYYLPGVNPDYITVTAQSCLSGIALRKTGP